MTDNITPAELPDEELNRRLTELLLGWQKDGNGWTKGGWYIDNCPNYATDIAVAVGVMNGFMKHSNYDGEHFTISTGRYVSGNLWYEVEHLWLGIRVKGTSLPRVIAIAVLRAFETEKKGVDHD